MQEVLRFFLFIRGTLLCNLYIISLTKSVLFGLLFHRFQEKCITKTNRNNGRPEDGRIVGKRRQLLLQCRPFR